MELPQNLIFFALIFVVMYFFMIRPQQKKVKQEKEFETALKAGDRVITKSGFHGKIAEINEQTIIIETLAGKLKIERSAISMELTKKLQEPAK
ncbi:MAG: preprotein translocase subunit YajC [Flavobacterium sp. BFFFF2]|nr:MAG: preprotein translocase subunit YajC [Flavobacterium sp. BFFFF2]